MRPVQPNRAGAGQDTDWEHLVALLLYNPRMVDNLRSPRQLPIVLAIVALGLMGSPHTRAIAQSAPACALLTTEDVQALAYRETVSAGVASSYAPTGYDACHYTWGTGIDRYTLEVNVGDPSRMFAGIAPDQFKQTLQSTVGADTADTVVSDVGDAAIFKADSSVYVHATALIKGRVLQITLDGLDARDKKGQVIALLKQAASKL